VIPESHSSTSMPARSIDDQLQKILASKPFAQSARMSRFLRFTVERSVSGQPDQLKEYVIGVEVFDRKSSYDPRVDPIVRVEARRLRSKAGRNRAEWRLARRPTARRPPRRARSPPAQVLVLQPSCFAPMRDFGIFPLLARRRPAFVKMPDNFLGLRPFPAIRMQPWTMP